MMVVGSLLEIIRALEEYEDHDEGRCPSADGHEAPKSKRSTWPVDQEYP